MGLFSPTPCDACFVIVLRAGLSSSFSRRILPLRRAYSCHRCAFHAVIFRHSPRYSRRVRVQQLQRQETTFTTLLPCIIMTILPSNMTLVKRTRATKSQILIHAFNISKFQLLSRLWSQGFNQSSPDTCLGFYPPWVVALPTKVLAKICPMLLTHNHSCAFCYKRIPQKVISDGNRTSLLIHKH